MAEQDDQKGGPAMNRTSRANQTRDKQAVRKPWAPPSMLDAPPAPEGFKHRWIRAELVRKDEYPDFESPTVETGKYQGVFGVGGLLLARIPVETVAERTNYFAGRSKDQMDAVDHDMMRENAHSSMTISKPDRQTRVTFGGPQK